MSSLSPEILNAKVAGLIAVALAFVFCFAADCSAQQDAEHSVTPPVASPVDADPETKDSSKLTLESLLEKYRDRGVEKWEETILKMEARSAAENARGKWSEDALLFFGSSSIRRWKTMNEDLVTFPAINRGYGGAKYVDMVLFADRILALHKYRALVLFAANDVSGNDNDSSPAEVDCAVREIIRVSKSHRPDAPVFIIEITPTESRFSSWSKTRELNAMLREIALTTDNTFFIATAQHYLNVDGTPKSEFFVEDKLHLNADGYKKWAGLIRVQLNFFLPALKQ
ncbi:GDSL-type esterase/lipase family protein [Mariniblastus fucicola]|uniref:SGNH hydrolase-type esterase domain-containing protein n=1 Tax=Mariniblastus fucicola TaxID=980251 RepID=A0A5B9PFV6_9BACT|nr:GDSL-type esterase/lipase family protein [Mariniblastus fucicola]QEG23632.1 hypothetical protein MFFC18_35330 [Mariniblastus fucicola]